MTDTTSAAASPALVAPPTTTQLLQIAAHTVDAASAFLPEIEAVSGMVPGAGPELTSVEHAAGLALPLVSKLLKFMMAETGKPLLTVFTDLVAHNTPTMPNSAVLSGPPDGAKP